MAGVIFKQPNGLYCRVSTIVDCPTHWNMTEEEYVSMASYRQSLDTSLNILKYHAKPFDQIRDYYCPNNMTENEFEELIKKMEIPVEELTEKDKQIY